MMSSSYSLWDLPLTIHYNLDQAIISYPADIGLPEQVHFSLQLSTQEYFFHPTDFLATIFATSAAN